MHGGRIDILRRPRLRAFGLLFAFLFIGPWFFSAARAAEERLDETDIRAMYKVLADSFPVPKTTYRLLLDRLDASFALHAGVSHTLGNDPAETGEITQTKTEFIQEVMEGYSTVKVESYDRDILDIKFSSDGQWGYVSSTATLRGSVAVALADNKTGAGRYTDTRACIDTLTVRAGILHIVRAECTIRTELLPPV